MFPCHVQHLLLVCFLSRIIYYRIILTKNFLSILRNISVHGIKLFLNWSIAQLVPLSTLQYKFKEESCLSFDETAIKHFNQNYYIGLTFGREFAIICFCKVLLRRELSHKIFFILNHFLSCSLIGGYYLNSCFVCVYLVMCTLCLGTKGRSTSIYLFDRCVEIVC